MSGLDSIERYDLEGYFEVFCLNELLAFHRPNSSEVSEFVAGLFVVSARLAEFCLVLLVPCYLFIVGILKSYWMD